MNIKLSSSLLAMALATGCTASSDTASRPGPGSDNDPPLADLDALLDGAPKADDIPRESFKADGVLPALYTDIRATQSSVKSQGRRGVCSIFSTVGYMEHLYIAGGHDEPDFSEQYLQWSAKFEVGSFPSSSGSNANVNLQAINRFGVVDEATWPYEVDQWDELDDPECDGEDEQPTRCYTNGEPTDEVKDAPKYRLPSGRWLHPLDIKGHLKNREIGAVVGMSFFYQSWNHRKSPLPTNSDYWDRGIVLAPNDADREASQEEDMRAGHSILIIGWDDDMEVQRVDAEGTLMVDDNGDPVMEKGFYLFKNSWGTTGFGTQNEHGPGYGWLSMDYVHEFGRVRISDVPRTTDLPVLPEVCDDGEDNDRDGLTDCDDSDCSAEAVCETAEELVFAQTEDRSIPDNDSSGIVSFLEVDTDATIRGLTVDVDISHTWRGDLRVVLRKGDTIVTLHDRSGSGADDLVASFDVTDWNGESASGSWQLMVSDHAGLDIGFLNSWSLRVQPQ